MKIDTSLMLVTREGASREPDYLAFVDAALAAGVSCVQLRDKARTTAELLPFAVALQRLTRKHGAGLIINDSLELAIACDADGLHLGQDDGSPEEARRQLGPEKTLGLSVNTWEELERANARLDIDYIGLSAIFPTGSKDNCANFWGLEGLSLALQKSRLPITAIGGISAQNVAELFSRGCRSVAVVSALHVTHNLRECVRSFRRENYVLHEKGA